MKCSFKLICMIFLFVFDLYCQTQLPGQWNSFTNMKSVKSAVIVGKTIWAATSGGIFSIDTVSGSVTKFNNINGLDTNDLHTIAFDGDHYIWAGGAGGWINVYDINTNQWQTIGDITRADDPNRGIQSFYFKGDTVFIVTEFGVSLFRLSRWEFEDTYRNIGFSSSPQVLCAAVQKNQIWIGTNAGLATASFSNPNDWINYTSIPGISSNVITSLHVFNDTLIVGTQSGCAYYANGAFNALGSFNGNNIQDIQISQGKLLILASSSSSFTVETIASVLDLPQVLFTNSEVQGMGLAPASSIWIATASKGLAQFTAAGWKYIYPNCPNSDAFNSLIVDANGALWCASGENAHAGFYRYNPSLPENQRWKNFTSDQYPIMKLKGSNFNDYHEVSPGSNGSIWVCSWGNGIIEVVGDSIRRRIDHYSSPSLPGAKNGKDTDFVVGGGVAIDDQGKIWIVNRNEIGGRSLVRLNNDTDTVGTFFDNRYNINAGLFHGVVIDQYDTKWMITTVPWHMDPGNGLFYFNENNIISGTQPYAGWGNISSMASNIILSIANDLEGGIWIGTGLGMYNIPDPLNPNSYFPSFPLREQTIQAIAVDALNNKWVGTKEGVFVVNGDGTQLLQSYTITSTNKRLLANDIRAIALDQKNGIAYFGTENGLSSLAIEPVQTDQSFSKLQIGPNPFIIPSEQPLIIRNLVANSSLKIITVSGYVIRQFQAQGAGRAFWDGKDNNGTLVSSGIYFVIAFAENGSQTVTGKVAVIRK